MAIPNDDLRRKDDPRRVKEVFYWLLWVWCWLQFGHGSNMGVATTFGAEGHTGNAEAFVLASWVCIGASIGLPFVSPLLRRSNRYRILLSGLAPVIIVCIALMFVPSFIGHYNLKYLYFARFAVGLAEAPVLPWITDWLNAYSNDWTKENTIVHIICPVAETVGFILSSELQDAGVSWEWNFVLQIIAIIFGFVMLAIRGGKQYLVRSGEFTDTAETERLIDGRQSQDRAKVAIADGVAAKHLDELSAAQNSVGEDNHAANFAETPHWMIYWAVNLGLATSLFAGCGIKFAVKAFTKENFPDMSIHQVMGMYLMVSLIGPGGGAALTSQGLQGRIAPEDFRQHRTVLKFMTILAVVGSSIGCAGVWVSTNQDIFPQQNQRILVFMASLLISMFLGAMAFPCAQALINNSLGVSWVIFASSMQTFVTNVISNVPGPWVTGYLIDTRGASFAFIFGMFGTAVTAILFFIGFSSTLCSNVSAFSDSQSLTSASSEEETSESE